MFVIHEAYQGSRTQLAQNNARFGWLYNLAQGALAIRRLLQQTF